MNESNACLIFSLQRRLATAAGCNINHQLSTIRHQAVNSRNSFHRRVN